MWTVRTWQSFVRSSPMCSPTWAFSGARLPLRCATQLFTAACTLRILEQPAHAAVEEGGALRCPANEMACTRGTKQRMMGLWLRAGAGVYVDPHSAPNHKLRLHAASRGARGTYSSGTYQFR